MSEQNIFCIVPCAESIDISKGYSKLELDPTSKMQMLSLLHQLPSAAIAGSMPQLYTVSFPNGGSPEQLMKMAQGGVTSSVIGEKGIIAQASFHSMDIQALALGCFTAMSIASSQYFLKQIGNELKMIKFSLDKIVEFLYGDKKAELLAEISFIKYAYQNYASIMSHQYQRDAMIGSILDAKKVAMKDIEFYMSDLDSVMAVKGGTDIGALVEKAFQIKEGLELALQLYGMSSLLEIHYAQNFDLGYIEYVGKDISVYIDKCEKRMLSNFSALRMMLDSTKDPLFRKSDKSTMKKQIYEFVESLKKGEKSELKKVIQSSLDMLSQKSEYYITTDGDVYFKPVN